MKRFTLSAAALALALSPMVATPAMAAETRTTRTTQTQEAFDTAEQFAVAAPSLPWRTKAANADTVARLLDIDGVSVQQRAIAIGKTQLGTYYRWGGTTPSGFDCSGFTRFSFRKAGVNLPRTAREQQGAVTRVWQPQPGDLVFYGFPAHHVGIYVGDGKMLHSPRTGKPIQIVRVYGQPTYGRVNA